MDAIRDDIVLALTADGFEDVDVRLVLSPAWTTDWMSEDGRRKLGEYGIAPPSGRAAHGQGPIKVKLAVKCPRCGSLDTREVSRFGYTSCKALYECRACLEPFDHFKVIGCRCSGCRLPRPHPPRRGAPAPAAAHASTR